MKNNVCKEDLRGLKSPAGFNVLYKVLLGGFVIPQLNKATNFEKYLEEFEGLTLDDKRKHLMQLLKVVDLEKNEIMVLLSFCKDKNGVAYSDVNINNLMYYEILELCGDVLTAYADCKLFF